jgi:hypothetical protein
MQQLDSLIHSAPLRLDIDIVAVELVLAVADTDTKGDSAPPKRAAISATCSAIATGR